VIEHESSMGAAGPFHHCALIHQAPEQYLRGVMGMIERGLAQGAPVIVAVPPERAELITARLNGQRSAVEFVDMRTLGRNPAWIIPAMQRHLERHRGRRAYVVCEPVWPGRSAEEIDEVILHEALCNAAFAADEVSVLCPFDAQALDASVIAEIRRTHRLLADDGSGTASPDYTEDSVSQRLQMPLSQLPPGGDRVAFSAAELGAVRALVAERARAAGLPPARQADFVFVVNELATNSVRHGGGAGELELRVTAERVIAEVRDPGMVRNPLAGRVNPDQLRFDGLGLWLVNQLSDFVQLRSGEAGTTVRVQFARSAT
jgi:anti-sigma regulatory factor (Ser/Thr protein kinase)